MPKPVSQPSLFDSIVVGAIQLPVHLIDPHPLNPRPQSDRYGCRVDDEKVEELISLIQSKGYDESEPIAVRKIGDRYQLLRGHHRWIAVKEIGNSSIPAVIREMDDKEAAIALLTMQGKEVDSWSRAIHAYDCCKAYGGDGLMTVSEYAEMVGKQQPAITKAIQASEIVKCIPVGIHSLSVRAATDIAALPESDWRWFAELCIGQEWGEKERSAAIKAVKAIDIPEFLTHWLSPKYWKNEAAINTVGGQNRIPTDVANWVKAATECFEKLPSDRPIWKFKDDRPYQEPINLQERFLAALPSIKNPSATKAQALQASLLKEVKELDRLYAEWENKQKSQQQQQQLEEERLLAQRAIEAEYSPIGFNGNVTDWEFEPESFDAIITDPPYLLSNDGHTVRSGKQVSVNKNFEDKVGVAIDPSVWVPIAAKALKPGGCLVVTCTEALLYRADLHGVCEESGLELRQTLIWDKPNAPPLLSADRCAQNFEFIYVALKPGAKPYFGYEDVMREGKQAKAVISHIPQCGGKERLGWHDTQKPLELGELLTLMYVPPGGRVADLFAGTATFTVAAKRLGRKSAWVEQDPEFFAKADSRIEAESFPVLEIPAIRASLRQTNAPSLPDIAEPAPPDGAERQTSTQARKRRKKVTA
jgi:site-specific DNA-methyltransferase (adenine-specific)